MNPSHKDSIEAEWARPAWISARFGIARSTLYDFLKRNLIQSASFKKDGQTKGQRLINVQSVRNFVESHIDSGPSNSNQPIPTQQTTNDI